MLEATSSAHGSKVAPVASNTMHTYKIIIIANQVSSPSSDTLIFAMLIHVTEKERIPTIPVSTVPFLRDPNFVERSEYRQLAEKLSLGRTRVALTGFGGAGCV
jgi:hypothetical protein